MTNIGELSFQYLSMGAHSTELKMFEYKEKSVYSHGSCPFFFATPELSKIVLPKVLQFWQGPVWIYILHLSCKGFPFDSKTTHTRFGTPD